MRNPNCRRMGLILFRSWTSLDDYFKQKKNDFTGVRIGSGKKVWKMCNAKLTAGDACRWLKELWTEGCGILQGVWGSSPRKFLDLRAASAAFQCFFLGHFIPIPIPPQPKKILLRFTLIPRMVLSWQRLKSEDSFPCSMKFGSPTCVIQLFCYLLPSCSLPLIIHITSLTTGGGGLTW